MHNTGVLISEHDERVNRVLSRIIKRLGLEPYPAVDYQNFKQVYNEKLPEIILLSLDPADRDNGEFCRFLAEHNSQSIIILLTDMEEDDLLRFQELGSSAGLKIGGVLRKPLDVNHITELLSGLDVSSKTEGLKKNLKYRRLLLINNGLKVLDPDQRYELQLCVNLT